MINPPYLYSNAMARKAIIVEKMTAISERARQVFKLRLRIVPSFVLSHDLSLFDLARQLCEKFELFLDRKHAGTWPFCGCGRLKIENRMVNCEIL